MKAVVLLSGGLDSATVLAAAKAQKREIHALTFDYGQRHRVEIEAARAVGRAAGVEDHRFFVLDLRLFDHSALTSEVAVPKDAVDEAGIPATYVPARNTIFLSIALGYAETIDAEEIWLGVNAVDYSGYPDCRPAFIEAFQKVILAGTKSGTETQTPRVVTPLISLSKGEIIQLGKRLGVDYALTHSCYDPDDRGRACGHCDSCLLRKRGFEEAGVGDPTVYRG